MIEPVDLATQKSVPCEAGTPPMAKEEAQKLPHNIGGLSENDFIMAAKIDQLV